jgi:hypothetical protein
MVHRAPVGVGELNGRHDGEILNKYYASDTTQVLSCLIFLSVMLVGLTYILLSMLLPQIVGHQARSLIADLGAFPAFLAWGYSVYPR